MGIEDKAGQGRGVDGVGALCAGGWPGLAQAADLAGSAARPNGGRRAPPPGLRGALPRPANAWQWRRAAPNRGYHLPARSAAPRAPPHPAGGGAALRSEPGIPSARTLRGSKGATPSGRRRGGAPLRTGDTVCPHAPRLRGRHPIRQEERAGGGERAAGGGDRAGHTAGRRRGERGGAGRAEPRSVRADSNRGSERAGATRGDSGAVTARGVDPG